MIHPAWAVRVAAQKRQNARMGRRRWWSFFMAGVRRRMPRAELSSRILDESCGRVCFLGKENAISAHLMERFSMRGGPNVSSMVDGELRSRTETTAAAFSRSPKGRPEHAPPPPRPLGRFGGNIAVIADRFWFWIIKSTSA